ncbi:ethanolamine utilization protein EutH [Anaerosalibacter bizertensis]|uniref:Ethanolamine utilization protein EutH n=1 Tax=Anaerosalibacter bizertensis TaxID=932217 RepID=A0A844FK88_9FIRM|nr:ethanolamine utilization protein EutH [Anaerosalibacter bizertensis]MBV1820463.1 ethanolamine utilization protein EutH [Bacteroidales bacterium MSK.15.36]HHV26688.1 ethanolamine utilization protein EutH [Tissierellia bacterium]MBU5293501.1 ethanolamine utilization protein EutH [Anaerosalibacter bizertensis]MCB5560560.1 ethanolamine utilization protein EutH [Anaerosalibacter bizertensis]MCG4566030.1 ethanolamine utilization protein EutH [Anaerosalibacter bizertensis]
MGINDIIVYIMTIFLVIGAIDRILGNKYGYGEQFEEGIIAMGSLALAMVGIVSLAPVLATILKPIVVPIYTALGADPSMFATTLLALDMGGYPLAIELAQSQQAGLFSGIILGAMMGPTIVFTIPVALGIIEKEDHKFLATGILAGMITIPIGCLVGGLVAGFELSMILKNLVPIVIVALLLALGLWKKPEGMIKGFIVFGKGVVVVITIGLAAIAIETLTGIVIIPGMAPISEGIAIVGDIAIMLAGAFPMVYFITKVFKKPLLKLGKLLGMGDVAAAGLVASLANNIPMFGMMKDMDDRGKIINVAFAVSASFVFGDHLGFVAGVEKDMIFPMIVGKLVGGITAIILAMFIANKTLNKQESN